MDIPRSSIPVAGPGASESLILSPQLSTSGSPSAVRGQTSEGGVQRKKSTLREHDVTPMQPVGSPPSPTVWQSMRAILLASYLNVLLVCIPISWALNFALPNQHTLTFVFSFLAILPLTKLLVFVTDDLSLWVGQTLAGFMQVTLRNAVGLIISITALTKCELYVVQSALVGSILNKLLLVLGMCFFAGGLKFSEQGFGLIMAQMSPPLLTISVIAVLIPSAFVVALSGINSTSEKLILDMSRGVAIILLFIYISYLFFQFISHKDLYQDDSDEILESKEYSESPFKFIKFRNGKRPATFHTDTPLATSPQPQVRFSAAGDGTHHAAQPTSDLESGGVITEDPQLSVPVSIGLLIVVTIVVTVTAVYLEDSVNGLANTAPISKGFIGIILLPIVGNAAELPEQVTEVTDSLKDKLTLSLNAAVGSSIQIALFVIPFSVVLGWILDKPLSFIFDPLQSIVLFFSTLTVNYVVHDGKSNWLKGLILICLYLILCVTFWYYPGMSPFWADMALVPASMFSGVLTCTLLSGTTDPMLTC